MKDAIYKDAIYFSHDSNARHHPKILKLRSKYGWAGYGVFWAIIEMLREQTDYKWPSEDKELLTFSFTSGNNTEAEILDYCISIGLLEENEGFIYSQSLNRRMVLKDAERQRKSIAGKKGAEKRWNSNDNSTSNSSAIAEPKQSHNSAIAKPIANDSKERKEKERKEKESKENKSSSNDDAAEDGDFQNPAFGTVATFIEQNIQPLTPSVGEQIGELIDLYKDAPLIIEAFKGAMNAKAKNNFSYASATLKNWKAEFITNISQLEAKRAREQPRQYNKPEKDLFAPSEETLELERQQYKEVLKDYVPVGDPFA